MKTKYELSMSTSYVPDWTVVDAVRELFQNALDQQTVDPTNEMFFTYDKDTEELRIGNKLSVLTAKSLLMGSSTKAEDDSTIGKFGEGYKVATMVLLREGISVTFFNYGAREVWKPRIVNSRKYDTKVVTFFVDKSYFWHKAPDSNLTIVLNGIKPEEYELIKAANLHLQEVKETVETSFGRVLLENKFAKKVFVNGLFVCNYPNYIYGYDFKPKYIKLDRDRKLVSDFDLRFLASKMWSDGYHKQVVELIEKGAEDVSLIRHTMLPNNNVKDAVAESFVDTHGSNAVPVETQEQLEQVMKSGYTPVMTTEGHRHLVLSSSKYNKPVIPVVTPLKGLIQTMLEQNKDTINREDLEVLWLAYPELVNSLIKEPFAFSLDETFAKVEVIHQQYTEELIETMYEEDLPF